MKVRTVTAANWSASEAPSGTPQFIYHAYDPRHEGALLQKLSTDLCASIMADGSRAPRILQIKPERMIPREFRWSANPRHYFETRTSALLHACAHYVMHMNGTPWEIFVDEIGGPPRLYFISPLRQARPVIPGHMERHPLYHEFILVFWVDGQITAIPETMEHDVLRSLQHRNPRPVIGLPQERHDFDRYGGVMNSASSFSPMDAVRNAGRNQAQRKERVCANCSSTIKPIPGIDMAVVESILGCQNCGMTI